MEFRGTWPGDGLFKGRPALEETPDLCYNVGLKGIVTCGWQDEVDS